MTGLSLAADGRTLAYEWRDAASGRSAVHVADIGTAGDWVADSRRVASYDGGLRDAIYPLISADGSAVYLSVPQPEPAGGPHWNQIVDPPLAGGQPRILFGLRYTGNPGNSVYMWTTVCRTSGDVSYSRSAPAMRTVSTSRLRQAPDCHSPKECPSMPPGNADRHHPTRSHR